MIQLILEDLDTEDHFNFEDKAHFQIEGLGPRFGPDKCLIDHYQMMAQFLAWYS